MYDPKSYFLALSHTLWRRYYRKLRKIESISEGDFWRGFVCDIISVRWMMRRRSD